MQTTMNNNQTSTVSAVGANRFVSWFSTVAKKVASVFVKPKKERTPFTFSTFSEGIEFIEWRTKYDHQRIVRGVETILAVKAHPALCEALGIKRPTFNKVKADIVLTDSGFERRLVKFFGLVYLHPRTQYLLQGGETKAQELPRTIEFEKMVLANIKKTPVQVATYESQLLREFDSVLNAIQLAFNETEANKPKQPALVALPAAEEVVKVAAETLPTETPVENTTPLTDEELARLRQAIVGKKTISELKLPYLKLYAKAHKIGFGRKTRIADIKAIVKAAQSNSTKIVKI